MVIYSFKGDRSVQDGRISPLQAADDCPYVPGGTLMRLSRLPAVFLLVALLAAPATTVGANGLQRTTGGGSFLFGGAIPMQFSFAAVANAGGSASGSFHHFYADGGFSYEFWGEVTCVTFDAANPQRAWIGGVLTKVSTDDPDVGLAAGDDAWFRVLDSPGDDRSTSMGFVGAIESSEAYCAMQIWPDDNARTHPVTEGQIKVALQ
jgi:hypothetical protein